MKTSNTFPHTLLNRRRFMQAGALTTAGLALPGLAQDMRLTTVGATAQTQYGRVRGLIKDGVHQFWGVPYGASTAGANRFLPPQPPASWSGVNDHFQIALNAPVAPGAEEPAPVVTALNRLSPTGEDCLNVNIFTPGVDNAARPVMVWLHGGGFSAGAGNYLLYDGTNLAKKEDVVVVSVNHRLNIFGFLHLADIGGEKWAQASNVGMQDIVATLQWIQDNIANFGGDPDRVTVFGQSGGGRKTTTLMAMPSAEGLFHRCISQSGVAITGISADVANEGAERFLGKLGIRNNQLDRLQSFTTKQIQDAYYSEPVIRDLAWARLSTATSCRATSGTRPRRPGRPTYRCWSALPKPKTAGSGRHPMSCRMPTCWSASPRGWPRAMPRKGVSWQTCIRSCIPTCATRCCG